MCYIVLQYSSYMILYYIALLYYLILSDHITLYSIMNCSKIL